MKIYKSTFVSIAILTVLFASLVCATAIIKADAFTFVQKVPSVFFYRLTQKVI